MPWLDIFCLDQKSKNGTGMSAPQKSWSIFELVDRQSVLTSNCETETSWKDLTWPGNSWTIDFLTSDLGGLNTFRTYDDQLHAFQSDVWPPGNPLKKVLVGLATKHGWETRKAIEQPANLQFGMYFTELVIVSFFKNENIIKLYSSSTFFHLAGTTFWQQQNGKA